MPVIYPHTTIKLFIKNSILTIIIIQANSHRKLTKLIRVKFCILNQA
jgi:hypothetical protein